MTARQVGECCTPERYLEILLSRSYLTAAGCWEWTGTRDKDGYAKLSHHDRDWRAHRFAWSALIAPVPSGLVVDHLCRNRSCVNVEHLEPVTVRENTMRGWAVTSYNSRKLTCPRGHTDLKIVTTTGERWCPRCTFDEKRARRDRNAAAGLPAGDLRHGTMTGYDEFRCRCNDCRAVKARLRPSRRKT